MLPEQLQGISGGRRAVASRGTRTACEGRARVPARGRLWKPQGLALQREGTEEGPVRQGDDTGVDAVCTYRKEPSAPPLDSVGLYHEVSNKTRGITQLGPYSLDKDSLYVNGYNEQPVLPSEYLAGVGWAQKAASASWGLLPGTGAGGQGS
ncbi:hypothetical protein QYF61_017051 [Mycteria americana]|uniref:Uncharacterized protein n=1 Tax=Mycteria americana TaxID=33587 RepID=A0AAN7MNL8_MYCAM|nr:hypothetical protein QYF61_017051 [Mycteria americana]